MSEPEIKPWWKLWEHNQQWRENLAKRAAHKALDVPEDDMHIQANRITNQSGMPYGLALAGILAAATIPAAAVWYASQQKQPSPPAPATMPALADSEYDVRFYDKDGNLIEVPHISKRK